MDYNEVILLEKELLLCDIKTQRKLIRKLNRKYQKLDTNIIVFRCATDYLAIDKIEELLEKYDNLLIKYN